MTLQNVGIAVAATTGVLTLILTSVIDELSRPGLHVVLHARRRRQV